MVTDKKLFYTLLPYHNRRYYHGRSMRWMIADKRGKDVGCLFCGNIANAIGRVTIRDMEFNIPVCKGHVRDYMDRHFPDGYDIALPCVIIMNLKFKT
jgi:hypothetical protein